MFKKRFFKKNSFLFFSLFFFISIILFTVFKKESTLNRIQKPFSFLSFYSQKAFHHIFSYFSEIKARYFNSKELYTSYTALEQEHLALKNKYHQLQKIEKDLIELKEITLLKQKNKKYLDFIIGQVIAWNLDHQQRIIKINKGLLDGVKKDSPVLGIKGLIGKVVFSYDSYSEVMTLIDENFQVDILDELYSIRGIYQGSGEGLGYLKYIARTLPLEEGLKIYTAGVGGIFPKGIPVGIIHKIEKKEENLVQKISIQPFETIPFSQYVLIYVN